MRKPRRLSPDELAPWEWVAPRPGGRWGVGQGPGFRIRDSADRGRRAEDTGQKEADDSPNSDPGSVPELPTAHCPLPTPAIEWRDLFGNAHPVELEVGMGKGLFLLTEAVARPGTNFFGIEIVRKYQVYAATRYAVRKLPNVKTACGDAKAILRDHVPAGSLAAVHVLFPDPWWKKRHKKRRVFTPDLAADAARAIAPGGRLNLASDVGEYFGVMVGIARAMPAFREVHAEVIPAGAGVAGYRTNFERKARLAGTPVWRAVFERTAEAVTVAPDPAESLPDDPAG